MLPDSSRNLISATSRPGVGNPSLVAGQKQTARYGGRYQFPPTIPFFLLVMMLIILGNYGISIRLTPDFHSSLHRPKYDI